jgi:hypothetical protein
MTKIEGRKSRDTVPLTKIYLRNESTEAEPHHFSLLEPEPERHKKCINV